MHQIFGKLLIAAGLTAATAANSVPPVTASAAISYHWAQVQGVRVFYREAGPSDAPVIVLLHGFPSSSRMYDVLLPVLSTRYHVIAPDYPGFGQSDAPPPSAYSYTFDHLSETMDGLLESLGIERYSVFMQDYGGPVGFRMALRHPAKVQAIIIQNANAYEEGLGPKWSGIAQYWAHRAQHPEQVDAFLSFEGTRQRHLGTSPNLERYNPDSWCDEFAALSRPGQREIQASLLYDYRTNIASYPAWQAWLRAHRPPTLVLWGRYDPSFIAAGAHAYRRDVPDAEIHILDAGHFALDEQASRITGLLWDFLDRHLARASR
jgi:pimeloyl-ACP methyl ester carboxylesterase